MWPQKKHDTIVIVEGGILGIQWIKQPDNHVKWLKEIKGWWNRYITTKIEGIVAPRANL